MENQDKIIKNLRMGKYIILATNLVASIVFLFVYSYLDNVLILYLVILLVIVAIAIFIYFSKVEEKFRNL